jgi:hypothetical protein
VTVNLSPDRAAELLAARHAHHKAVDAEIRQMDQERAERKILLAEHYSLKTVKVTGPRVCHRCGKAISAGSKARTRSAIMTNPRTREARWETLYFHTACVQEAKA